MALAASINSSTRIAVEATPGTAPTTGFRQLQSVSLRPTPEVEIQKFKADGQRYTGVAIANREWATAALSGLPDFNELHYFFNMALKKSTPGLVPTATLAYLRNWSPAHNAPNDRDTITAQTINGAFVEAASYGTMDAFGLKADISNSEISGNMLFRRVLDSTNDSASAGTLAATVLPQVPVSSSYWTIAMADTAAGLDAATPLGGGSLPFAFEYNLSSLAGAVFGLDGLLTFQETVELDQTSQLKLTMAYGTVALGLKQAMRTGQRKFIRLEAIGPEIEAGFPYSLTIDMCVLITAKPDDGDNQGAKALTWTFDLAYDATWEKAINVELVNAVS